MDSLELMKSRHSVRAYRDCPLTQDHKRALEERVKDLNRQEGLYFRLVFDEPDLFKNRVPSYGQFKNVKNYLLLAADKKIDPMLVGYWGEDLVLFAQSLGVNSCWVGMARFFHQGLVEEKDQKLFALISLGYGLDQGKPRPSKSFQEVVEGEGPYPDWFVQGVEAGLLAPTAMNQQKFTIRLGKDGQVDFRHKLGIFARLDLGIVKYHFDRVTRDRQ